MSPSRRGFLAALVALVAAPWLPKAVPVRLVTARGYCLDAGRFRPLYWYEEWMLDRMDRQLRVLKALP